MSDPFAQTSVLARLVTDGGTARRLFDTLMEVFEASETAVTAFEEMGAWTVEIYFERPPNQDAVREIVGDLAGDAARGRIVFTTVAARDWVAQSLRGLAPVAAGRFVVHGAHHRNRVTPNRIGIEIEAALAFGTGHHGTTRGCLMALDRILNRRHPRGVLDIGCGTGVLAIATARATRWPVLAGDIDPVSVRVARDNARLNRVGTLVKIIRANGLSDHRMFARAPFDLVFANILLGPLKLLAKPIYRLAAPGARIVVSGLLPAQVSAALAAYRPLGLVLEGRILLDGWATLILVRPAPRSTRYRAGRVRYNQPFHAADGRAKKTYISAARIVKRRRRL